MNPTSPRSPRNSSCAGAFAEARTHVIELTHETGAWLAALKFMYTHTLHFDVGDGTGQSPPSAKKALACFRLADYLGADCLSLACVEWMREFVSPANCCLLFASGLDMRDTFLASSIVAIATEAIGTCISYEPTRDAFWDCFARLSPSHMRDLVRSHDLKVISESALLDAVIFWAEYGDAAEYAESDGASARASSGRMDRTDRTPDDITSVVSLLDLQRIPNDVLAATVLSPRAVLEPTKELFAAALARNITNAPKRPPRGRIVQGIVFARQNDHGAPFELFIGDPDGKMYRVHDSPTFTPRCSFVACNKRIVALGGDIEPDGAPRGVPTVDILDLAQPGGALQPTGDGADPASDLAARADPKFDAGAVLSAQSRAIEKLGGGSVSAVLGGGSASASLGAARRASAAAGRHHTRETLEADDEVAAAVGTVTVAPEVAKAALPVACG